MKAPTLNRPVLAFMAIAYTLSIAFGLIVGLTGGHQSRFVFGLGVASMFVPAFAVFVVSAMGEGAPSFGWNRFPLRYLPIALLLMPVVMHAVMLPVAGAVWGGLPWADWLTPQADGLYHTPASRNWGVLSTMALAGRIALNAGVGVAVNSTLALFEEIGWRSWMLPRVMEHMSGRRAVAVSAAVWGFWHTPFALSGIHHLDGVPIVLTALTMPIVIIGAGLVIGWLWLRTASIWMVALAHGALNNWGQYAFKYMEEGSGQGSDVLILAAGGLGLVATGTLLLAGDSSAK